MANDKTVTMSRELAQWSFDSLDECIMRSEPSRLEEMRALLAAPVVERQEPVAYIVEAIDPNNGHLRRRGLHWHPVETLRGTRDFKEWIGENLTKEQPLYTSPPAPVAVTMKDMMIAYEAASAVHLHGTSNWCAVAAKHLNSRLDKIKGMNQ